MDYNRKNKTVRRYISKICVFYKYNMFNVYRTDELISTRSICNRNQLIETCADTRTYIVHIIEVYVFTMVYYVYV